MFGIIVSGLIIGYSITINGPGLTQHGMITKDTYSLMKHRIGGKAVVHPVEFGLTVKSEHFQVGADYLHDCFDNPAGAFYFGPKVDFLRYFSMGGVAGLYVRGETKSNDLPIKKVFKGLDLIPLAGATFSITVPVTKHLGIEVNTLSNFYITHSTIGLKIGF